MLAPLEVYGTIQALGIAPAWPLLPDANSFMKLLTNLFYIARHPEERFVWSSPSQWLSFFASPCFVWAVINITRPIIAGKLYHYFRAGLPKPTNPDRCSIIAGEGARVPGMRDEDKIDGHEIASVQHILARDLQTVGRLWQVSWDGLSHILSATKKHLLRPSAAASIRAPRISETRPSSASTVQGLPDDLREAMAVLPGPNVDLPRSENVLGLRPEFQDLLDPMPEDGQRENIPSQRTMNPSSSPLAGLVETATSPADPPERIQDSNSSDENHGVAPAQHEDRQTANHRSASSSSTESRILTPPPSIEITSSTADPDSVHVNLLIPTELGEVEHNQGFHLPTPSDTSSNDIVISEPKRSSYHRVTCLSTLAADSLAEHLSDRFADLLFLPLEALFVRGVARNFWPAPGLAIAGRRGAGRWTDDIFPLGGWFGFGLRAGGWGLASGYAGKMLLVWGMHLGLNFVGWELTTRLMWWAGLRYYGWRTL